MESIVLIPSLIAVYIAQTRALQWAFLDIYIPALFLIPVYYSWSIPMFPDPNFQEAIILPLMLFFVYRGLPGWRFSWTDVLVFTFTFSIVISEYLNVGYKLAQNLTANMLLSVFSPYILAKSLVEPMGLRVAFVQRIVLSLFLVALILPLENIIFTGYTLWQKALGRFFPGQGWFRDAVERWGLRRANGPFIHPIVAGLMMMIGFRLQRWLQWNNAWPKFKKWPRLPAAGLITLVMLLGVIAPLSRGPWLAGIIASLAILILAGIVYLAKSPTTRYLLIGVTLISVIVAALSAQEIFDQFSQSRSEIEPGSHERQTIAYRVDLYTTYGDIVLERWMWGWGRLGWPQDKAQWSIDNYYLALALNHGLIAVASFIILCIYLLSLLFIDIMHQRTPNPPQSALNITLFALILMHFIFAFTVSLSGNSSTVLFIIFGWADGYLLNKNRVYNPQTHSIGQTATTPFKFSRVM
ncbi:MAG: O-antigen ligase family protein [Pseudomonadota bacterium]|nr:O-antigen ligase family protein [Pseudomonadota bacterium]